MSHVSPGLVSTSCLHQSPKSKRSLASSKMSSTRRISKPRSEGGDAFAHELDIPLDKIKRPWKKDWEFCSHTRWPRERLLCETFGHAKWHGLDSRKQRPRSECIGKRTRVVLGGCLPKMCALTNYLCPTWTMERQLKPGTV